MTLFSPVGDLRSANGWVVDTSVAVCLQAAGWTEVFLDIFRRRSAGRQLAVAPRAFLNDGAEPEGEFAEQLDVSNLELWRLADSAVQGGISPVLASNELPKVRDIIRASRRGGRKISRADAEGIYIAEQRNFALLTGDYSQAEWARNRGVTVVHKATVLEMTACDEGMAAALRCAGLLRLVGNSLPGCPCELSDRERGRLREIHRQYCPDDYNGTLPPGGRV